MTFQEFLGRLLTERDLRRRYREAPEAVLAAADMDDGDRNAARALEIDAVERQARALVHKRYTEVRQMLPATFDALGHSALQRFADYADTYWPEGHRRHQADVIAFIAYLRRHRLSIVAAEARRLCFRFSARRLQFGWQQMTTRYGKRRGLQILYRVKGRPREAFVFVA